MNTPTENAASVPPPLPTANASRRGITLAIGGLVLVALSGYAGYRLLGLGGTVTTDNAYVQGNLIQITPQIAGTVLEVRADDTDFVRAGQLLARLDPADSRVALDQAESQLAQTVREVRTLYANNEVLGAQIALRQAEVSRFESELARAQVDARRREALVEDGAVGREEFEHANTQLTSARSALASTRAASRAAQAQLAANMSLTDRTTIERHPNVLRASARVREAYLALHRAEVNAPVDGFVARRNVQVGQRVQAGAGLMTVVPLDGIWVDANFKEAQLRHLRVGQAATLVSDLYGNDVRYHGTVAGLGAGTGAAFALLPAQNATGNWIKVVQRVPVRIQLDPREVAAHALRIGLSVEVSVDTRRSDGPRLGEVAPPTAAVTTFLGGEDRAADEAVRRIIGENLPEGTPATTRKTGATRTPAFPTSPPGSHSIEKHEHLVRVRVAD
ncbi:HlyD family efflux transporter periplasmic adaptor subunit [Variovorax sp. J31P207]|uniref:HlyD family efflux transporter periplasmic adaptor subunit n=1 Tax=Variovorax sp. J31P207 TaxID=3053510 RepID=UPI002577B664|nr:HlyD family efflux transporter periplasmic adaptor subunit [Variovorax sp. J31P207]MDM0066287.1 HlyD family efflux transporter periplasmic adaptor subunit [Variovorax sp. J31P207]